MNDNGDAQFARFDELAARPHWVIEDGRKRWTGSARPLLNDPSPRPYVMPPAANDNNTLVLAPNGGNGGETLADMAARILATSEGKKPRAPSLESPLDKEMREGRISIDDELTARVIEHAFERAHRQSSIPVSNATNKFALQFSTDPLRPIGAEITVDALKALKAFEEAAGDCWPAVVAAVMGRMTMQNIGVALGCAVRRAASEGRERVVEGLRRIGRVCFGQPLARAA